MTGFAEDRHPQTAAEHADEARRILRVAEHDLTEAMLSHDPKLMGAAIDSYAGKIATAQVHATLALVPEPLEPIEFVPVPRLSIEVEPGARVVFVQPRPSRKSLILASEVLGTVTELGTDDEHPDEARVLFDDEVDVWLAVGDLRVVLGA